MPITVSRDGDIVKATLIAVDRDGLPAAATGVHGICRTADGQELVLTLNTVQEGVYQAGLDISTLAAGTYTLVFTYSVGSQSKTEQQRLVIH